MAAGEFANTRTQSVSLDLQPADQNFHARDEGVGFLYGEYFLELMLCQAFASTVGVDSQP